MLIGFFRVLASGVLLLLALTTTTMFVQPAGASTATATSATSATPTDVEATDGTSDATAPTSTGDADISEECATEISACIDDATCADCMALYTASTACPAGLVGEVPTSTQSCVFRLFAVCCADYFSEFDCLENDQFVEYWRCVLDTDDCSEQELVCEDVDGAEGASNGATSTPTTARRGQGSTAVIAFPCAFGFLVILLWV